MSVRRWGYPGNSWNAPMPACPPWLLLAAQVQGLPISLSIIFMTSLSLPLSYCCSARVLSGHHAHLCCRLVLLWNVLYSAPGGHFSLFYLARNSFLWRNYLVCPPSPRLSRTTGTQFSVRTHGHLFSLWGRSGYVYLWATLPTQPRLTGGLRLWEKFVEMTSRVSFCCSPSLTPTHCVHDLYWWVWPL